ncbi:pyridoxine 5'-phosphate synthase [Luteibaculum oceani]|uniref:Pyridoxine 5'-phosphate synthase n=1 Tax=Luteibaculum oceani TaxID=1294296 RepID=A0A5C6V142_9FLAO|nr:pyridoxine 5'-phosphate synthase [Luteibaculum oceani]TXC78909.1 pyridoxine 5'-phosphate synthase [Luteibaculum oceani]
MTKLSVNINKVATLRNARGGNIPNVIKVATDCENFGAEGITVHPRPDERHIRYQDVRDLSPVVTTEFNIEGYPSKDFLELVKEAKPAQVTLVPDPPHVLTSNAGWTVKGNESLLEEVIAELKSINARVSLFMDAHSTEFEAVKKLGADRVELYTEEYATQYPKDKIQAIAPFKEAFKRANDLGLGVNAGHDLSLENLAFLHQEIPGILEVSIGHALIADALYYGLENTIQMYKRCLMK